MWWAVSIVAVAALALMGGKALADSGDITARLRKAARGLRDDVRAAARKHAAAKGVPLSELYAVILLESGGNPKAHAKTDREDSYGAMQVNANAHAELIHQRGWKPTDLFDPDKAIDLGSTLWARARKNVQQIVGASQVRQAQQAHDLATLTRLSYAAPAYVEKVLRAARVTKDTGHLFKDSETYVDHWRQAVRVVAEEGLA
jgi:hypothetical protein